MQMIVALCIRLCLITCTFVHPKRPDQSERRVHKAAQRHGLGLGCEVVYREIPVCTGYDDEGDPVVELMPWPFILPHMMVAWHFSNFDLVCKYFYSQVDL